MSNPSPLLPAIAPASGGALTNSTGPQRIAMRMAENLLSVARSQERALAAQRRYRIGDYEFREADYAQIQRWAGILGMESEKVVEVLANRRTQNGSRVQFSVEDGTIVSLVWDFALLPLTDWEWGRGLQIARLSILNTPKGSLPPLPECLYELICDNNQLTSLTLAQVPKLKKLHCSGNRLTELDLTAVPELQELYCRLTLLLTAALDLTPVPGLQKLYCSSNLLTALDLTPVPELQELDCSFNRLTSLNLIPVPGLQKLYCSRNPLTTLDLTPVSGLQVLHCSSNRLTSLNLTPVPELQKFHCDDNQLTALDLAFVPGLQELDCSHSPLTALNLSPATELQSIRCDRNLTITGASKNLKVRRV